MMVSLLCQWYIQVVRYMSCLLKQAFNGGRGICTSRQVIIKRSMTHTLWLSLFLRDFRSVCYLIPQYIELLLAAKNYVQQARFCTDAARFQQATERFTHRKHEGILGNRWWHGSERNQRYNLSANMSLHSSCTWLHLRGKLRHSLRDDPPYEDHDYYKKKLLTAGRMTPNDQNLSAFIFSTLLLNGW